MNAEAMILRNGSSLSKGKIRNIGLEGLFLEADTEPLIKHNRLDIRFTLEDGDQHREYQIPVLVRHLDQNGVGVMFLTFEREVFQSVQNLLYVSGVIGVEPSNGTAWRTHPSAQSS